MHYSSVAYALISHGKTQPQRISPLTAYPVISVSCLTGRVEIYLGVTRDAPLHDYTQTCSRCARGLMCLEFDSWGEFWAVVLHGVQTVCPELCWSHLSSHQFPENKGWSPFPPNSKCRHGGMRTEKGSHLVFLAGFTDDLAKSSGPCKGSVLGFKDDGNP